MSAGPKARQGPQLCVQYVCSTASMCAGVLRVGEFREHNIYLLCFQLFAALLGSLCVLSMHGGNWL